MKLAMVVPPQMPCPPPGYGGVERVCDVLVRGLIELGNTVDLYAGPNSTCPATNLIMGKNRNIIQGEQELVSLLKPKQKEYDCIIDSAACHFTSMMVSRPTVAFMTGDAYLKYPHHEIHNRIYVSREYAEECGCFTHPYINNVICNDPENEYQLGDGSGGYSLVYSTIGVQKGVHLAARASERAGMGLVVAGPMQDHNYWNSWCNFPHVKYVGVVNDMKSKLDLLMNARVLYFMSVCGEGDALTPKEAMACGTPVVATIRNGIRSFLEPHINGYFASYTDKAAEVTWLAAALDRNLVRESALEKLDPKPKAKRLEQLCKQASMGLRW